MPAVASAVRYITPMTLAILLIVAPVVFTAAYVALAVTFRYPTILREPTAEVLGRFSAGGTRLVLTWWLFALSALLFVPIAALGGSLFDDSAFASVAVAVGVLAGLVQALGLIRWVFVVPYLARESAAGKDVDVIFQVIHRYLGVAVGEHFGYLLTGTWTVLFSIGAGLPLWLAIVGVVTGGMLLLGSLEFVGPFERSGSKLAGLAVTAGYSLWSLWLVATGILLLVTGRV